jgi:hypothetical protein
MKLVSKYGFLEFIFEVYQRKAISNITKASKRQKAQRWLACKKL